MELLLSITRGRNEIFNSSTLRLLNYSSRTSLLTRYMNTDDVILENMNRLYTNHLYTNVVNTIFTISPPTRFNDPVIVAPTQLQINSALEPHDVSESPCAICQDNITTNGVRIRHCQHSYHRSCISNWFSMSVRCPVCRYDIREVDQTSQTSSVSSENSAQAASQ